MNRWSAAAVLVLVSMVAWLVVVPWPTDCPNAGIKECGGFQVSPFFVIRTGLLLASFLGFMSVCGPASKTATRP